jgi:shikimate 5-dehydrogenase
MQFLDQIVHPADEIGAVNTVEAYMDRHTLQTKLRGHNVDWIGMLRPIENRLRKSKLLDTQVVCLVVGAGGTARAASYVAKKLNLKLKVYNRTYEKAKELAAAFGGKHPGLVVRKI